MGRMIAVCAVLGGGFLSGCGGGGSSSAGSGEPVDTPPHYISQSATIYDDGGYLYSGNSAYFDKSFPMLLAGTELRNGQLHVLYGGTDITLVNASTLDVQMGGETIRFTYNTANFRFEDGQGRHFNTPQIPLILHMENAAGGLHADMLAGLEAGVLPGGLVTYSGGATLALVDSSGDPALSQTGQTPGSVAISIDFLNDQYQGTIFTGTVFAGQPNEQIMTVQASGQISGSRLLPGTMQGLSNGGTLDLTDTDLTGVIVENGAEKVLGIFAADYSNQTADGTRTGKLVGSFRGYD